MKLNQSRQNNPSHRTFKILHVSEFKQVQKIEVNNNYLTGAKSYAHPSLSIGMVQNEQYASQGQSNQVFNNKSTFRNKLIQQNSIPQKLQNQQLSNMQKQTQFNSPIRIKIVQSDRSQFNRNMLPSYETQDHQHSNQNQTKEFRLPTRQNQTTVQGLDQTKNANQNKQQGQQQNQTLESPYNNSQQFTRINFQNQLQEQQNQQEQFDKNFYQPEINYINQQNNKLPLKVNNIQQQKQKKIKQDQTSTKQSNQQQSQIDKEKNIQALENFQICNNSNQQQLEKNQRGLIGKKNQNIQNQFSSLPNSLLVLPKKSQIKFISHSKLQDDNKHQFQMNRIKSDIIEQNTYDQEDIVFQTVFQTVVQLCKFCQQKTEQFTIGLKCQHQFHFECLLQLINSCLLGFQKNQQLRCLCGSKISSKILRANFPDQMEMLMNLQVQVLYQKYSNQMFKCQKCSFVCIKDEWKKKYTFCDNCQILKQFV